MIYYLIGMPGVGKTRIGEKLADRLRLAFFDIDTEVEQEAEQSVVEIFESGGEKLFRNKEYRKLLELSQLPSAVVACGGGMIESSRNRAILAKTGVVIWLQLDLKLIESRLSGDNSRPLLRNPDGLKKLHTRRLDFYKDLADIHVNTSEDADIVVKNIQHKLDT